MSFTDSEPPCTHTDTSMDPDVQNTGQVTAQYTMFRKYLQYNMPGPYNGP